MMNSLFVVGVFFCIFISCGILLKLLTKYLLRREIVDYPGERRIHGSVTPRGGGIAIVVVFLITFLVFNHVQGGEYDTLSFLLPILLLVSVSFWEDMKAVPITVRLITHLLSAYILCKHFVSPNLVFRGIISSHLDIILATVCLAFFVNIYNFLDGIDGITSVQSVHLSLTILALSFLYYDQILQVNLVMFISSTILACSLSFLCFNWHPASIFLGDVGSTFLGLVLGFSLMLIATSSVHLLLSVIIASLYYIVDGVGTLVLRMFKKEKIWLPHLNHFFQKAVRNGQSPSKVCMKIILCNSLLLCFSILSFSIPVLASALAVISVVILVKDFTYEAN